MAEPTIYAPHDLGRRGEAVAAGWLLGRGWRILATNYRFGRREVDLVVRRDDLVAFVEVKTRAGAGYGPPEEAVTLLKRREIEVVAQEYLARHRPGAARSRAGDGDRGSGAHRHGRAGAGEDARRAGGLGDGFRRVDA